MYISATDNTEGISSSFDHREEHNTHGDIAKLKEIYGELLFFLR